VSLKEKNQKERMFTGTGRGGLENASRSDAKKSRVRREEGEKNLNIEE